MAARRGLSRERVLRADRRPHRRPRARRARRPRGERPGAQPRPGPGGPMNSLDSKVLRAALLDSVRKLDPRHVVRNPVMFVVEVGAFITTIGWLIQAFGGQPLGGGDEPAWFTFTVAVWLWLTVVFGNLAEALAEGRGKAQADALRSMRTETVARLRDGGREAGVRAGQGRRGGGRGRRADPRRRHGRGRHRVRRRVGHHRRVRAGGARVRRRPQRGHRRHPRAQRPDRGRDHPGAGPELPGPDDRPGGGRRAAQDPERGRAGHPARRA